MPEQATVATETARLFNCPGCSAELRAIAEDRTRCPSCGWRGKVFLFHPVDLGVREAEEALPDDATCANHPAKRAEAVCEGTGDYICALCAVELNGRTYSAQYLNRGGKEVLGSAFQRRLPRPDREASMYLVLGLLFYIFSIVLVPVGFYKCLRAFSLRKKDPLYREMVPAWRLTVLAVIGGLLVVGMIVGVLAVLAENL